MPGGWVFGGESCKMHTHQLRFHRNLAEEYGRTKAAEQ